MAKMTKKEMFAQVLAIVSASDAENKADLIAGIEHEVELLSKKTSKSGGMTKTQKQNEINVQTVLTALAEIGKPVTVTELLAEKGAQLVCADEGKTPMTTSKITAMLTKLMDMGEVDRIEDKKRAFYTIAEIDDDDEDDTEDGEDTTAE